MLDTVIRHGRVVDGTGGPWCWADVGVQDGRIVRVAPPGTLVARETVDASGHVVAPGFIDIQSHSIVPLLRDGRCIGKISQGVTLEVMGEGWTPAPAGGRIAAQFPGSHVAAVPQAWQDTAKTWTRFGDWLTALEGHVSPNVASFLAGGTLREFVCGLRMGAATPAELEQMRQITSQAMQDGAMGVAYALIYPPDAYVATPEIIEVCKTVARHGGIYITHMRSEGDALEDGLRETLEIARAAKIPAEIYHLKASGQRNWHKMRGVIETISKARTEGLDISADMYPYPASGTGLDAILPTWVSSDGKFWERLGDANLRQKIRDEVLHGTGDMNTSRPETIQPIGFRLPEHQGFVGKRLSQIAQVRQQNWVDCAIDLLLAEQQRIATVYFSMLEENLRVQVQQPWVKFSSDAGGHNPATATEAVHPRGYGTFPRVFKKYVREEGLLTLEDAVAKMTGRVATRLGLPDRGFLRPGCWADVVVFDADTIADVATFENPHQLSLGVRDVLVNGVWVWRNNQHTGQTPGRFVRGPGAKPVGDTMQP